MCRKFDQETASGRAASRGGSQRFIDRMRDMARIEPAAWLMFEYQALHAETVADTLR
jgi:hypothetical protein